MTGYGPRVSRVYKYRYVEFIEVPGLSAAWIKPCFGCGELFVPSRDTKRAGPLRPMFCTDECAGAYVKRSNDKYFTKQATISEITCERYEKFSFEGETLAAKLRRERRWRRS